MIKPLDHSFPPKRLLLFPILLTVLFLTPHFSFGQDDLFFRMRVLKYKEPFSARNFEAINLKVGNSVQLNEFQGKVVMLNFWATWCGPCKREMGPMEVLYKRFKDRGFVILALSLDQGGAKVVQSFVEKKGLTFPILMDPSGKIKSIYHVTSLPTTYLIDQKGRIIGKSLGPRDWGSEDAFSLIESLLDGSH